MIKFLAEAHRGVQGFVFDNNNSPIERASLKIKGRDVGFQTTKHGEFWRILLPGYYKLEVSLIKDKLQIILVGLDNQFFVFSGLC